MPNGVDFPQGRVSQTLVDEVTKDYDLPRGVPVFLFSYASQHPELKFFVTRIACGIAGFTAQEIAPLFAAAIDVENIILPRDFVENI